MTVPNIHERVNQILTVLNNIPLRGFEQISGVSDAMQLLASLDQDILKAEEKEKAGEAKPAE